MQNKTPDAESKAKFDLDKVEIPTPSVDKKEPLSHDPLEQAEPEEISDTAKPKSLKKTYLILSLLVVLLLITFSILWTTNVVRLPGNG